MIHLIENFYAEPNNMGFTLLEIKPGKDKDENPTEARITIGYVGSFEGVVLLLKRKVVDKRLQKGRMELYEAVDVIKKTTAEINEALSGVWL